MNNEEFKEFMKNKNDTEKLAFAEKLEKLNGANIDEQQHIETVLKVVGVDMQLLESFIIAKVDYKTIAKELKAKKYEKQIKRLESLKSFQNWNEYRIETIRESL